MALSRTDNIFLVGPLASGKSSVGARLAKAFSFEFYDSDREIEVRAGADISWIFELEQEEGYRRREADVIADLTQKNGIVLATGGGAVLTQSNREHLMARGIVVYLQVSCEQQLKRGVWRKDSRPLFSENIDILRAQDQGRAPLYKEVADLTYDAESNSLSQLVAKIKKDVAEL